MPALEKSIAANAIDGLCHNKGDLELELISMGRYLTFCGYTLENTILLPMSTVHA